MMDLFQPSDLHRFRTLVAQRLGLQFDDGKKELLADVLRRRLQAHKTMSVGSYLARFTDGPEAGGELRALASHLTVGETYFFRASDQFDALIETALPDRIRAHIQDRRLRFLSAGCASGEEPYSLAILLREHFPELCSWDVEILGLDINPVMIAKAREALYSKWSLRETGDALRTKYFRMEGAEYRLEGIARPMVRFEERNLAASSMGILRDFDIVLCRNVLMYLVPEAAKRAIASLTHALVAGGFLFLGYAETLRGFSCDFHLRHTDKAFYYQKRSDADSLPPLAPEEIWTTSPAPPADSPSHDEFLQTSEQIAHNSCGSIEHVEPHSRPLRNPGAGLGFIFELIRQERFQDALKILDEFGPDEDRDPDLQLLRAGLLSNMGDFEAAGAVCRQILSTDDLNAGAHYLAALCREAAGDTQGAVEHDLAAIYLDGAFAMPHLHLGRMSKRLSDLPTARRELERAQTLLAREDPSRILLFGGGFNREALVAFSRAELRACGGSL